MEILKIFVEKFLNKLRKDIWLRDFFLLYKFL